MSAPTLLPAWAVPGASDAPAIRRPGFVLLTQVELRKMTDTRAGRWLLIAIGLIGIFGVR